MFQSSVFNYVNVLDKALDASWLRNEAISNNIANATTPGYKRQDVAFETVLEKALKKNRYVSMDARVAALQNRSLSPVVYNDYGSFSYRLDKNNVNIETENVMLAENQLKYQGLMAGVNHEFSCLQAAMK